MAKKNHPGSLQRRGDSYRVTLCLAGRVDRFTVRTTDRRVAEQFARKQYAELRKRLDRELAGLPEVVRMSTLLAEFEAEMAGRVRGTRKSYADSLKPIRLYFVDVLADPQLDKIRAVHIDAYMEWRRTHRLQGRHKADRGPLHARTLNKDRAVLHRLFAVAERREYVQGNPVKRTERRKADAHEPVILTGEEYTRLLAACSDNPTLHLYVLTLAETGMRCESEALHLRWEDVSFETGFITVASGRDGHRTKTGRSRVVPMTPRLAAALRAYFATHRFASQSPYLFHHETTKRHHRARGRIGTLRSAFKATARRARLSPRFRQHDLRHRRVTTWLAEGQSPTLVMRAMGHSRLETTMAYYRFLPEHLYQLVAPPQASGAAATPPSARVGSGR